MAGARDIVLRQPIVICPMDQQACRDEMDAIEEAAKAASQVDPNNPVLPDRTIILAHEREAIRHLGLCEVGGVKKMLIE